MGPVKKNSGTSGDLPGTLEEFTGTSEDLSGTIEIEKKRIKYLALNTPFFRVTSCTFAAKNKKKKTFRAFYRIVNAFAAKMKIAVERDGTLKSGFFVLK